MWRGLGLGRKETPLCRDRALVLRPLSAVRCIVVLYILSSTYPPRQGTKQSVMPCRADHPGEAAVGKSSLVCRFVQNDFNENTSPTIGAAFSTQSTSFSSLCSGMSGGRGKRK